MTQTRTVKGKLWSDLRDFEEIQAVRVELCEGFGEKWALAFDENGRKYLADYEEIKAIVEESEVVEDYETGLIKTQTVVFSDQPKFEDYVVYAKDWNGKKICFKMSEVTSAKCHTKSQAKRILEGNDYKVKKILTQDEDNAWQSFMDMGWDCSESETWSLFRLNYTKGTYRKWINGEWVAA